MARSGSLAPRLFALAPHAPHFVKNDYVKAEITCSTPHAHQEVLTWSWVAVHGTLVWASPGKPWLLPHRGYVGVTAWLCYMKLCYGSVMATLWLGYGCCYRCCVSQERGCVMTAMPDRREQICLQFLWLPESPSSLSAHTLPIPDSANSANSVNSKTSGITNRNIKNTVPNKF